MAPLSTSDVHIITFFLLKFDTEVCCCRRQRFAHKNLVIVTYVTEAATICKKILIEQIDYSMSLGVVSGRKYSLSIVTRKK